MKYVGLAVVVKQYENQSTKILKCLLNYIKNISFLNPIVNRGGS